MIMDYISSLPVRVVDYSTPIFEEVVADNHSLLTNTVMNVEATKIKLEDAWKALRSLAT